MKINKDNFTSSIKLDFLKLCKEYNLINIKVEKNWDFLFKYSFTDFKLFSEDQKLSFSKKLFKKLFTIIKDDIKIDIVDNSLNRSNDNSSYGFKLLIRIYEYLDYLSYSLNDKFKELSLFLKREFLIFVDVKHPKDLPLPNKNLNINNKKIAVIFNGQLRGEDPFKIIFENLNKFSNDTLFEFYLVTWDKYIEKPNLLTGVSFDSSVFSRASNKEDLIDDFTVSEIGKMKKLKKYLANPSINKNVDKSFIEKKLSPLFKDIFLINEKSFQKTNWVKNLENKGTGSNPNNFKMLYLMNEAFERIDKSGEKYEYIIKLRTDLKILDSISLSNFESLNEDEIFTHFNSLVGYGDIVELSRYNTLSYFYKNMFLYSEMKGFDALRNSNDIAIRLNNHRKFALYSFLLGLQPTNSKSINFSWHRNYKVNSKKINKIIRKTKDFE